MKAYDPEAIGTFKQAASPDALAKMEFIHDRDSVLKDIDALIICTEWNGFRRPGFSRFESDMKEPVIFDGRSRYDLQRAEKYGITYYSVGRRTVAVSDVKKLIVLTAERYLRIEM